MKSKYKCMISAIALVLVFFIYISVDYNRFTKKQTKPQMAESLVFSMDEVSINFLTGNTIDYTGGSYIKEFSVTNVSELDVKYNISLMDILNDSNAIKMNITSNNEGGTLKNAEFPKDNIDLFKEITIHPGDTQRYVVALDGPAKTKAQARIYVSTNKLEKNKNSFVTKILMDNKINNPVTKIGEIATTNEGLIHAKDDYGDTYYFRGSVDNNYVEFANYKWRIVRITGDNGVKLVLDEDLSDLVKPFNSNESSPEEIHDLTLLSDSSSNSILETWYLKNLNNYTDYLMEIKTGINNKVVKVNSNLNYYGDYSRLYLDKDPSFQNSGANTLSKISLLTADEVLFAGGSTTEKNTEFYLYNEHFVNNTWLNTAYSYNSANNTVNMMYLNSNGSLGNDSIKKEYNLRPVIVLGSGFKISGQGSELTLTK